MYLVIPWRDDADLDIHQDEILAMVSRQRTLSRARETCHQICRLGWSADIVELNDPNGKPETWTPGPDGPYRITAPLDAREPG
jgi:hypothetical protein